MSNPDKTEIELECPSCGDTHGHIFYEPAPMGTFHTECPSCNEHGEHDVTDRIW